MKRRTILTYTFLVGILLFVFGGRVIVGNAAVQQLLAPVNEVVVTPTAYLKLEKNAQEELSSWQTYTDKKLGFSIQHPETVILDERQTVAGRIVAFVFSEDKEAPLPGKVTVLYVADTAKIGIDGFSAFRKGDCGKECTVSYKNVPWVNINNTFGVKNPMPGDVHNYFLTDKEQTRTVLNVYVGGFVDEKDKAVQEKIKLFEKMIKTFQFVIE
jgi:hypothetical protein